MTAEYRVEPETGDWRVVAPERAQRPSDQSSAVPALCPFDPGNETMTPPQVLRVPADPAVPWRVRVVPNRYPVVSPGGPDGAARWPAATGLHEVVIESPDHDGDLRFAGFAQTLDVLRAMRERCRAMAARRPAAVVVFRNHGAAAGTSLRHPHSQIVCLDQAPPGLVRRWRRARTFYERTGRCLHEDVAARERADRVRVVEEHDGLLVYQPWAGGVGHETVLLAADTSPDLAGASDEALAAMARTLPLVAAGLAEVRDDPAYNLVVHAGPAGDPAAGAWYRWHIGLYPRVERRAGLEIATGLGVNSAVPESTAPAMRAAIAGLRRAAGSPIP
jgi:UDPglucose--hexose-1-phosphate uridylyltransferase